MVSCSRRHLGASRRRTNGLCVSIYSALSAALVLFSASLTSYLVLSCVLRTSSRLPSSVSVSARTVRMPPLYASISTTRWAATGICPETTRTARSTRVRPLARWAIATIHKYNVFRPDQCNSLFFAPIPSQQTLMRRNRTTQRDLYSISTQENAP